MERERRKSELMPADRLLRYLDDKRREFAHTYEANCLTVARDIARLLIDVGKQPSIASIHKEEERMEGRFHYPVMPKKYGGRVTWTRHYVCCCGGMVYDPMLEEPVEIGHYSQATFGEDFPVEIFVSEEEMEEYLSR
jgi:hypothetical protein